LYYVVLLEVVNLLKFKEENCEILHLEHIALIGAGTLTIPKVRNKYLESYKITCWRKMLKVFGRFV
jgi:hypothetical protein